MDVSIRRSLRIGLLTALLAAVAVGCGGSKDDRDVVMAQYGEPDDRLFNEGPLADSEIWYYSDYAGSGVHWCIEFQRTRGACGGGRGFFKVLEGSSVCELYFETP